MHFKIRDFFRRELRFYFLILFLMGGCASHPSADTIIDKAIKKAGGAKFEHSRIGFTFRGTQYEAKRDGGEFAYQRSFTDSTGATITDRLTNDGFTRYKNGQPVDLPPDREKAYKNSVNSVIYFALLPYKLNDAAVQNSYLGTSKIDGEPYYEIGVSFQKEGGGKDYEDHFVYWINQKEYTMDYLAYDFEEEGGGTRFREAKNVRRVNGIRFADYNNFKGLARGDPLQTYDDLFRQEKVEKVSEINLDNIEVLLADSAYSFD